MSHANESEYQKLVDDFIEQFKGDFPDVVQDLGEAGLKDRLLVVAKYKMPDKEQAILVAQEPVLKIITSNSTTEGNRQKAINDYTNQLDASIAQTDKLLEGIEQKSNPTKSERRQHVDALFEMHMIMALQEKVSLLAENMRDPDTARVMANTQADARKMARDIKRQSMNLAKEAQSSNDPAVIDRLADTLTTMERRFDGSNAQKTQSLAAYVVSSEEKVKELSTDASASPSAVKEAKVDHAFYSNNQAHFRFSREGMREILQSAREMIEGAMAKASAPVDAAQGDSSKPKETRKSFVQNIQEKRAQRASALETNRSSQNASSPASQNPATQQKQQSPPPIPPKPKDSPELKEALAKAKAASEKISASRPNEAVTKEKQQTVNSGNSKVSASQPKAAETQQNSPRFPAGRKPKVSEQLKDALQAAKAKVLGRGAEKTSSTSKKM